jgi:hypothetical protein
MSIIEKNISNFIETQFPAIYREEGPVFVEFVKKYYEWLESSNNALYHSRRILDYKDIDETVDDFVLKFKQKYLSDIQFDTVSQTRQLIKHSLDLYRSKGTDRSVDLFFRAVFGKSAEIYYPGEDIFRLSDGKWVKPKYLEVTPSDYNVQFVGKQIQGVNTGATAFVERYIRRKVKKKYINVLYISAINGEFETGELVTLFGQSLKGIPTIIGSMTTLQVISGGEDFKVGDIVSLTSNGGLQGKARVSSISDIIGIVDFQLTESGWGYSANAEILISEKILSLSNVKTGANTTNTQFEIFETIKQPLANVVFINANNTLTPNVGDTLFTYYSNNTVAGSGAVLSVSKTGNTNGEIYIIETTGNLGPVYEPNANLAGTIYISPSIGVVNGIANVASGCNVVQGTNTVFPAEFGVGVILEFYAYNASTNTLISTESKRVTAIANNTELTVDSNFSVSSTKTIMQIASNKLVQGTGTSFNTNFVYGDRIAIYTNSTSYFVRTVNAVTNATFMSVQEPFLVGNTSANYSTMKVNNYIYTSSNTIVANIQSRTDRSVTANVMAISSNLTLHVTNTAGSFTNNQVLYQLNANNVEVANAKILSVQSASSTNASIQVTNSVGVFQTNPLLVLRVREANGVANSSTAKLASVDLNIGVINIAGAFITANNNFIYGLDSQSNATISRISSGVFADFSVSNTLQFSESITLNSEKIKNYANLALNSYSFGFPDYPSANITTQYLDDIFKIRTYEIGGISVLTAINPGKSYDIAPYVTIIDPVIVSFDRYDYAIEISNTTGIFTVGEIVQQSNDAKGQVRQSNSSVIIVKRLNFENTFDKTLALTGVNSGVSSNIVAISELKNIEPIGLNAIVTANVQVGEGSVTGLEVVDSGYGYLQDENATFTSADGERTGLARVNLGRKGVSEGYYRNKNGFLSDHKYIFDGEYYQDYSYEVRTAVTADKYAEMLKNVLHVAGTKAFYAVVLGEVANTSTNIITDITEE